VSVKLKFGLNIFITKDAKCNVPTGNYLKKRIKISLKFKYHILLFRNAEKFKIHTNRLKKPN